MKNMRGIIFPFKSVDDLKNLNDSLKDKNMKITIVSLLKLLLLSLKNNIH